MNIQKKERRLFLIINLIILFLIFILSLSFILVESAYIDLSNNPQYYRLVPGNEYRTKNSTGYNNAFYSYYSRIYYSSSATNDLFLPLKSLQEWNQFRLFHPSTIEFTYPTCEMIGNVNDEFGWGFDVYGCNQPNQKCYNGVCKTCDSPGYFYGSGIRNYIIGDVYVEWEVCWRAGSAGQSCNDVCSSYGGCNPGNWNDTSSCTVCNYFFNTGKCDYHYLPYAPQRRYEYVTPLWQSGRWVNECKYRLSPNPNAGDVYQDCGSSGGSAYSRLCVCNY